MMTGRTLERDDVFGETKERSQTYNIPLRQFMMEVAMIWQSIDVVIWCFKSNWAFPLTTADQKTTAIFYNLEIIATLLLEAGNDCYNRIVLRKHIKNEW